MIMYVWIIFDTGLICQVQFLVEPSAASPSALGMELGSQLIRFGRGWNMGMHACASNVVQGTRCSFQLYTTRCHSPHGRREP